MGYTLGECTRYRLARNFGMNAFVFAVLANLPDVDFLPGFLAGNPNMYHHHQTHSLGFAAAMAMLGGAIMWLAQRRFWPCFWLVFAAVSSHLVLDLLTQDFSEPYGMMLLWPLSSEFYDAPWKIFLAVHKSDYSGDFFASVFSAANLHVAVMELAIMLPLAGLVTLKKFWRRRAQAPTGASKRRISSQRIESTLAWKTRRQAGAAAMAEARTPQELVDLNQPGYRNGKG